MTVRERMLVLSLMEKAEKNPDYAKKLGLTIMIKTNMDGLSENKEKNNV